MILRFSYARFHFVYIKQLTGLFGEISENSSRLQTNAWNFKCNFAGGGTVYKLNFVSGALESSTRQRLPIIQNLMQTVSTLSKSIYIYIYPRPKSGSGLQSDTQQRSQIYVSQLGLFTISLLFLFFRFFPFFGCFQPLPRVFSINPSLPSVFYSAAQESKSQNSWKIGDVWVQRCLFTLIAKFHSSLMTLDFENGIPSISIRSLLEDHPSSPLTLSLIRFRELLLTGVSVLLGFISK